MRQVSAVFANVKSPSLGHGLVMKADCIEVPWAYRTTAKSTTRETLFLLAYGYEAMVLVKIGARYLRRDNFDLEQNMILQRRELDFLEEKGRD